MSSAARAAPGRVLPIVFHPAPILRAVCAPVADARAASTLVADLLESARAHGGLGLAAPQLGAALRAFALLEPLAWTAEALPVGGRLRSALGLRAAARGRAPRRFTACLNPRILSAAGEARVGLESCLSVPARPTLVRRARAISVEYEDAAGATVRRELSGLPAVVFQHELDHLDGVLVLDRAEAAGDGDEEGATRRAARAFQRELAEFYA